MKCYLGKIRKIVACHLQYDVVVVNLDPLGDPGDGKELLVLVKLDARHDGAVVEHVRGVGQGGEGTDTVIPEKRNYREKNNFVKTVS